MSSSDKGDRRERELVNILHERGYAVMRAPSSGSGTERNLPDILAGDGSRFYAFEVKASQDTQVYLDGEEIEALIYFTRNFGARARIAVRFDREDWYFFHPNDLYTTNSGNYRIKREKAVEHGLTFDDL